MRMEIVSKDVRPRSFRMTDGPRPCQSLGTAAPNPRSLRAVRQSPPGSVPSRNHESTGVPGPSWTLGLMRGSWCES
jgi:hypothetical protein